MPQNHIHIGGGTPLSGLLIQFRQNLLNAIQQASQLHSIMDNMNDAVDFSIIEDEFGINPQYAGGDPNATPPVPPTRVTDTNCNGYKLQYYITAIDNLLKSNGGDGSNPQDKAADKIATIINDLA